jgi:MIP family channel proteins
MSGNKDDIKTSIFWRAILAEFIGTLFLTFIGCGSCIGWDDTYNPTIVQISLAFGLGVATMVWAIGHVSGGHINPAVTCAMLITRKIGIARAALYIVSQSAGALVGAALLKVVTPGYAQGALGQTSVHPDMNVGQGFGVELLITFVLVFTVFGSCDSNRTDLNGSAPLAIGLSVTLCHLFAVRCLKLF